MFLDESSVYLLPEPDLSTMDLLDVAREVCGRRFECDDVDCAKCRFYCSDLLVIPRAQFFSWLQTSLYQLDLACVVRGDGPGSSVQVIHFGHAHMHKSPCVDLATVRVND